MFRNMKKAFLVLLSSSLLVSFAFTKDYTDKDYWGYWTKDSSHNIWEYISSEEGRTDSGKNTITKDGFTFEADDVLVKDGVRYFRTYGRAKDFSLKVTGLSDKQIQDVKKGKLKLYAKRENVNNKMDSEKIRIKSDLILNFSDAVSGDNQLITLVSSDNSIKETITVKPHYNREHMGSFPIIKDDKPSFKVTYEEKSRDLSSKGPVYYAEEEYTLNLKITNIADVPSSLTSYSITSLEPKLKIKGDGLEDMFTNLESGQKHSVQIDMKCGKIEDTYIDAPLLITLKDDEGNEWKDKVTIRFYKGKVKLEFDTNNHYLEFVLISPRGEMFKERVTWDGIEYYIPYGKGKYRLYLRNDQKDGINYSFSFNDFIDPDDVDGNWKQYMNKDEPNDDFSHMTVIKDFEKSNNQYLHRNDVDIFTFDFTKIKLK